MSIIQGAIFLAAEKRSLTLRAPTPIYNSSNSLPLLQKNGTPASPAIALANIVFPVPGGPTSKTPFGSLPPRRVKRCQNGKQITIINMTRKYIGYCILSGNNHIKI
ncbi:hypothetical protein V8G54_037813 [Vigna mungo]|uniref:Uncharacterized protein n=1 Tax=Vigna mungo TaxID=3915 RepID=A0AAQ3MJW8_VIGMU